MIRYLGPILSLTASLFLTEKGSAQTVLSTGPWYKFSVSQEGVYKINHNTLAQAGISPSSIDPTTLKIYSLPGGMLPQDNAMPRPDDLQELAIYVSGENDGLFNTQDYILFYAHGSDSVAYNMQQACYYYQKNLYDNTNYIFLTVGGNPGKRMETSPNVGGIHPVVNTFNDYTFHELNQHNLLHSGREWYGEKFDFNVTQSLSWNIPGITPNSTIKVVSDVVAQSATGSSFSLSLNGTAIGTQTVLPVGSGTYAEKGKHAHDTLTLAESLVNASNNTQQTLTYQYNKSGNDIGYLDYLLITWERNLARYHNQTIFLAAHSTENPISTFQVAQMGNSTLWDITNLTNPKIQSFTYTGNTAVFSTETTTLKRFIAFTDTPPAPVFIGPVSNQNIRGMPTPHVLIISHPDFVVEAERLAQHRASYSNVTTQVVALDQIYNEFSSGRQDIASIRDFARHLHLNSPGVLQNLVLLGKGSYQYLPTGGDGNYIPTYESRNSLDPLSTFSSDDFYGFLDEDEGLWAEGSSPDNHEMDIGVGRIPATSLEEARIVVDKIINYDNGSKKLGKWRKKIIFIADDGDINAHQNQADQIAETVEAEHPEYDTRKIYIDAFPQTLTPAGERVPEVNHLIRESLDQGALVINYTGHGNEYQLADERIFDNFDIPSLSNDNLPLLVTATCEFGRQDDPLIHSSAELCVLQEKGGAIGTVSTTRPVYSSTNFELNKAFYQALFERDGNKPLTLGEIFRRTKNNSISGISNRNFSLMGDPSLTLAFPQDEIRISEIQADADLDTIKALSRVTITGDIVYGMTEDKISTFSGTVYAVLYDKKSEFITLGNENAPFYYNQWKNALFRGKATVQDGSFSISFIAPKNITYKEGYGRLTLYAQDPEKNTDARGVALDVVIGKSASNPESDITAPKINLYLGDTTFVNGGSTPPNTLLIARLFDESGINISHYGIGNSITAILDDTISINLNDYYEADLDNYQQGWLYYPLNELAPGTHQLELKVWDTYNNPASQTLDFTVTEGSDLQIERFVSYPNPFTQTTTLYFHHNRSGDDLQIQISIYGIAGNLVKSKEIVINSSPYHIDLVTIGITDEFGENLPSGVYLARLFVRSLSDGAENEQVTKLIRLN